MQNDSRNSISDSEIREELEKVLSSASFRRSARLSRFLGYIVDKTLHGQGAEINEYLIGSEVFQRGADYSPTEDSVVRRQAHSLRQKLDEYYAQPGRADPLRIEVPVGHYVPFFRRPTDQESSAAAEPRRGVRWAANAYVSTGLAVAFVLGCALAWMMGRNGSTAAAVTDLSPGGLGKAEEAIWGPWLSSSREPVICFSNPMTMVVKHFGEPLPEGLPPRFPVSPGLDRVIRERFELPSDGHIYMTPSVSQAKMGEAAGAALLANMFGRRGLPIRVTQSRFLSWDDFRKDDLILLGHTEANRWLEPILKDYPLRMASTEGALPRRILNTKPRPGEAAEFSIEYAQAEDEPTSEYALVSMLPGLDEQRRLLLINRLNTQATQMAVEFLTDPVSLDTWVGELTKLVPGHRGPWYFQLVVKAEVRDKVPTGGKLVLLRAL